ncbi:hypothetical protein, partial [Hyphomonas sp.]|uniref:hypothetical protein n=1 Tax=Hyphomonas sp. TaxID=87 RepID=UPI002627588B
MDAFEQRPLDNHYGSIQIMHALSPDLLAAQEAETMRRLNALSEEFRACRPAGETGKTPPSPHDAHA